MKGAESVGVAGCKVGTIITDALHQHKLGNAGEKQRGIGVVRARRVKVCAQS